MDISDLKLTPCNDATRTVFRPQRRGQRDGGARSFIRNRGTDNHPEAKNGHGTRAGRRPVGGLGRLSKDSSCEPITELANLTEQIWTREQLAERLNVSTTTISRWRRRGLAARRVRSPDGKVRVVFGEQSVRRFIKQNSGLVRRAAEFGRLTSAQKQAIVERACRLLGERCMTVPALAERIAEETGFSSSTVGYTLRRHHAQDPANSMLNVRQGPVFSKRHLMVLDLHQAGRSAEKIAGEVGCDADEVRRLLRERDAVSLVEAKPRFVGNELFDARNADELIMEIAEPTGATNKAKVRVPPHPPAYLAALYRIPLLTREQEADLFRRYNYLKYKAAHRIERLEPSTVSEQALNEVRELITRAGEIRLRLITANLRLVVSIARRRAGHSSDFFELVSDGNLSLMRAIETFDYARGNRFSTYATWAITRELSRSIPAARSHAGKYVSASAELVEAIPDPGRLPEDAASAKELRRALEGGLAQLDARERAVIKRRVGWNTGRGPETLQDIGRDLGVSKERVRQIQEQALVRLRGILYEADDEPARGAA